MALSAQKITIGGLTTNQPGAYFQSTSVTAVATGNGTVVPAGMWYVVATSGVTMYVYDGTAYSALAAAGVGGFVVSDGVNVYLKAASGTPSVTLVGINGGLSATGTFNQ
jgi:hypothetical protein